MYYKQLAGISLLLLFTACSPNESQTTDTQLPAATPAEEVAGTDSHTSRNSVDWPGTYSGILPCADCPGIETVVTLRSDGSYESAMVYIDEAVAPETGSGTFSWDQAGSNIVLGTEDGEVVTYQVGENQLFRLDSDGQRIAGDLAPNYILSKHLHDPQIEDKRWQLVELQGAPVEPALGVVLTLQAEDSVASGNASCNGFSGSYAIKNGQRISFGRNMAVTMMACPDMSIESAFLEVLAMADNYSVGGDSTLSLNRARMAPLARFEIVAE